MVVMSSSLNDDLGPRISFYRYDSEDRKWKSPALDNDTQDRLVKLVREKIEEIRVSTNFEFPEGYTNITKNRIITANETDLLDDQKMEKKRGNVKKNLTQLVNQLSNETLGVSGTEQPGITASPFIEGEKTPFVIGVYVPTREDLWYERADAFNRAIETAKEYIEDEQWQAALHESGWSSEDIQRVREQLATLGESSKGILEVIGAVKEASSKEEKAALFFTKMPELFRKFEAVLREWQTEQYYFSGVFGNDVNDNPFLLDMGFSRQITRVGTELLPEDARRIVEGVKSAIVEIKLIIADLNNPTLFDSLVKDGCDPEEIIEYRGRLYDLIDNYESLTKALELLDSDGYREALFSLQQALSELIVKRSYFMDRMSDQTEKKFNKKPPLYLELSFVKRLEHFSGSFSEDLRLRWVESTQEINTVTQEALEEASKYNPFYKNVQDRKGEWKAIAGYLSAFTKNYRSPEFFSGLRKKGMSDLQIAAQFNHLVALSETINAFLKEYQEVVDLVNLKRYQEAVEKLAEVYEKFLPQFDACARKSAPYAALLSGENGKLLGKNLKAQTSILGIIAQLSTRSNLDLEGFTSSAAKSGLELDRLKKASSESKDQTEKTNQLLGDYERVFVNSKTEAISKQLSAVSLENFSESDRDLTMSLFKQLQQIAYSLQTREQAVELERNPVKKRALHAQLREYTRELVPQMNNIREQFKTLRGISRFRQLAEDLEEKVSEEQRGEIEQLFTGKLTLRMQGGFPTKWKTELTDSFHFMEIGSFFTTLADRADFINQFHARQHFYIPFDSDSYFKEMDIPLGWSANDIQELRVFFEGYHEQAHVLLLAKARLDEDPENIVMQKEFLKYYNRHIGKINRLTEQFQKKFGERNLNVLGPVIDKIRETDAQLISIGRRAEMPFSWEKGFLDILTDIKTWLGKLLAIFLPKDIKYNQLRTLQHIFEEYRSKLSRLNELQARLDRHPASETAQKALLAELQSRAKELRALETRVGHLYRRIIIPEVEETLEKIDLESREWIESERVQKLEATNMREKVAKEYEGKAERTRKGFPAEITTDELEEIAEQCERIRGAIEEKRAFMFAIYREHGLEGLLTGGLPL